FAVEDSAIQFCQQGHQGFNGATANSPWRTREVEKAARAENCFNGATANSPWRTCHTRIAVSCVAMLQWGHGEFAVEADLIVDVLAIHVRASMGPRRIRRGGPLASEAADFAGLPKAFASGCAAVHQAEQRLR